ncbi:MAG: restriction endonuclease subunit S [Tissierellia bacterium]|nr:restriction endonuclease subunit S [Tissierellia bacterium]
MEYIKLNELCEINIGKTPSRNNSKYWGDGFYWLSISDMKKNIISETKEQITDIAVKESNMKIVPKNTVVMSFKLSIGKTAILGNDMYTNEAIANFPIKNKDTLIPEYLIYALQTLNFNNTDRAVMGATLNKSKLNEIKIPYCNLEIQKKIVNILNKAQELINKRKEQIEALDELVKSKFIEMFGNPVTNSKGWNKEKLNELGRLARGKSKHRPRNAPELLGGPYPLVQTGDIANAGIYLKEYTQTYSELGLKQSKMWDKGTLCITIAANIAKTSILTFDACFPDSVVAFIPNEKTNTMYIQFWMSFLQKILEDSAPESAQKNINLKILSEQNVIVPPIELQNEFAAFVQQVDKLKFEMEKSLKELEDNFNSLMQRAFKGELFN